MIRIVPLCLLFLTSCFHGNPGDKIAHRFFVSSQSFSGNLAGLAGADIKCQLAADAAGLGGVWKAWLSTLSDAASTRLSLSYPLVTVNGIAIFETENERLIGLPRTALNVDENGHVVGNVNVWTNTDTVGASRSADCNSWTTAVSGMNGGVGLSADLSVNRWTDAGNAACNTLAHLYCVEQ